MLADQAKVEKIVEIVAREVLIALAAQEQNSISGECDHCTEECTGDVCVMTCFDRVGRVVNAGAARITSSLGGIPEDPSVAGMIDHTLLKPMPRLTR